MEKNFFYLIYVGRYEDYDYAIDYLAKNLRNLEELSQAAAIQALDFLVRRFYNIKEDLILPLLFENLKSSNKRIYGETFSLLRDIKGYVPRLKRKIYLAYVENGVDFFTDKKLKIFTDKGLIYSLNNEEEKKEFILSFCQNSLNYQEALEVCLYFLRKNESEEINIAAFKGLTYIVFRFRKIEFKTVLPFIRKYLSYSMGMGTKCEYLYAESLLQDIAIVIPKLRMKAITFLKKYSYVHLIASTFVNYVITKINQKIKLNSRKY
ncbi:hypothetical protein RHORCCE3_0173 [Rickettsia hoogstraalii str. RCCE3]|nr:hypothetical protein RHORCCE3_0173 [Rickettsia hoogstraalii str. RCCE3]